MPILYRFKGELDRFGSFEREQLTLFCQGEGAPVPSLLSLYL
jgi:hypothetical protein